MKIIKKSEALKLKQTGMFTSRYDLGKYKPECEFIGKEVQDLSGVAAVYPEIRKNKDGKYIQLMCLHK